MNTICLVLALFEEMHSWTYLKDLNYYTHKTKISQNVSFHELPQSLKTATFSNFPGSLDNIIRRWLEMVIFISPLRHSDMQMTRPLWQKVKRN